MASAELWSRIKAIVGEALEREPSNRPAFLDRVCANDSGVRAEVESLIAAYGEAGNFSIHAWGAALTNSVDTTTTIGPYRLRRELGCGGMGQVWLAEQTKPVQRRVALKLIRTGFYDSAVMQRFLAERQSLASMDHPAIAKVFDAGSTVSGQPYFVMEYVEGLPITAYCETKKLGVSERLRLFLQVCEGVQHAHQKAIIHRDLKPSNILIVEVDGKPAPRIIDFGLAKSIRSTAGNDALLTQAGSFLGTPGYMSPEQAGLGVEDVDTRSDVYSLGVILYELLTGFPPFEPQRWKNQRLESILKEIRETDPQRPSTKAGSVRIGSSASGMEARQLAKALRGDLDWITLKALEKSRDRRYGTPSELAADIENYFQSRPVKASAAGPAYRMRKYLRRNRMAASVMASAIALLIAFAVMQSIQLRRIQRERDRADRVTQFMTSMFKVSDPGQARGNNITAREILDKSSKEIQTGLTHDPDLQATLENVMGNVYEELGLYSRAQPLLERSAATRRGILGPNDSETLKSVEDLAWILHKTGDDMEAEKLQRKVFETRRRVQGPEHPDTQRSEANLAATLGQQGRYAEAEQLQREGVANASRSLGPEHSRTLVTMTNLANTLEGEGRYAEAKRILEQTLTGARHSLGKDHPITLASMTNLAVTSMHMGQYAEAQATLQETRSIQRRVLGPNHPDTAGSTYNLACVAAHLGQRSQAVALLREAVEHGMTRQQVLAMKDDDDFQSLRGDAGFQALIAEVQKRDLEVAGKSE